jgi:hypothetical protein
MYGRPSRNIGLGVGYVQSLFEPNAAKNAAKKPTDSYVAFVPEAKAPYISCHVTRWRQASEIITRNAVILTSEKDGTTQEDKVECVKEERRRLVVVVKEERHALGVFEEQKQQRRLGVVTATK